MSKGDLQTALSLGLNQEEYNKIIEFLGREPNFEELSVYSVMWSEHCSYKNSIKWLKTLPKEGPRILVSAGEENAGLVDIGDGLACAFKIESHNHPSAIEPYQGAATGVGGIHRDIFTLGARPIAALNSLRFGDLSLDRTKHLLEGVVKGIGDYGNCFGVPTVAGETYFMPCYNQNILVNAMSAGIVKVGETVSAIADGPGNPVFIVGAATGKDGIHGATFASADLNESSSEDLPSVQVGDPFQEKLLLEASLEAIQTGAIVGMQDMGAAGISCSTSEMSAKSGTGMKINLDLVPTRQDNMQAFEILLSESQERMLIVGEKGKEQAIIDVFDKWDVPCVEIGEVTDSGILEFFKHGQRVAEIPADSLVLGGGAPVYDREYTRPSYLNQVEAFNQNDIPQTDNIKEVFEQLIQLPNLCYKGWISEQYDKTVRGNTMNLNRPADAAAVRVKGTQKALALSVDCNSAYVFADPFKGAMMAVCEAARNVSCTGAIPSAITNCLNFGNPYNSEVYYQFVHAIKGMSAACEALSTPVTGGNVSFYNQTELKDKAIPVYPTPTIGMMGVIEDIKHFTELGWNKEGDFIYMLGNVTDQLSSSEYLRSIHGVEYSPCPPFNLEDEVRLQKCIQNMIQQGWISNAHDVSDGGLLIALAESSIASGMGVKINRFWSEDMRQDGVLFGEGGSRILIGCKEQDTEQIEEFLKKYSQSFHRLGRVEGEEIQVDTVNFGRVSDIKQLFESSLNNQIQKTAQV
ncbi:MAG TPA: phosphoribosylformylglycinamidine synthase subunit PurL [Saprospiraceae bacterium]|nr:phosphoribosylformylglycinamidine synthase subunit PurL [Saprospiraceae bacterium]